MRSIKSFKIFFLTLISICISSCNDLKVCDCDDLNRQFFTLIDDYSNKNLLSGADKRYFIDSITLFSIELKNGKNFRKDYAIEATSIDSVFIGHLNTPEVNRYFIGWNNRDLDTIDIETKVTSGSCCGDLYVIKNLDFNNVSCATSGIWSLRKK